MAEEDNPQNAISKEVSRQPLPILIQGSCCSGSAEKKTWPELVGLTSEEAERRIKEEMPRVSVQVVPQDCFVTMDYRLDRVRIFTDSAGKVSRTPMIG